MRAVYLLFSFSICICSVYGLLSDIIPEVLNDTLSSPKRYMRWPNATVAFYVNPDHFDHEQSLKIYQALSMFAFKTCMKFAPVMAMPTSNEHVLVFVNPTGIKRCVLESPRHSFFEPHVTTLGYDCLQTPNLEMMIMNSLGFPFEHNRSDRDTHIDIMMENVDPSYRDTYTKDISTPPEFLLLPYDQNSLMHFGYRDFSINGHRTFVFLNPELQQNRIGLTPMDIRKFELVYGPECLKRDRLDQVELCRFYPDSGTVNNRRKRNTELKDDKKSDDDLHLATKNLRVNPNITPPQDVVEVTRTLKTLGIEKEVQSIVESVFKVSTTALANAKAKYCKVDEKANVKTQGENDKSTDVLGFYHLVSDYAKGMVDTATANITQFCEDSESMTDYLRMGCDWQASNPRCRGRFRPTKSGPARYSTQHRPLIPQSTKNWPLKREHKYEPMLRSENGSNVQPEDDKQENVASQNGGVIEAENEKKSLTIGGTELPTIKKSLRRHRQSEKTDADVWSIVKDGYIADRDRTNPNRPNRYSKTDKDNENDEAKKDKDNEQSVETDFASSGERNINRKEIENIDYDIEGDPHKKDANDKENYEDESKQTKPKPKKTKPKISEYETGSDEEGNDAGRDSQEYEIVPKEILKSNKHAESASVDPQVDIRNQNSRFQVKKQREDEERNKKRHKKIDTEEEEVNTESKERKGPKRTHQPEMEEDESRVIVLKKPKEMVRKELKHKTARKEQKEIAQKGSIEMAHKESEEIVQEESIEMVHKESEEMVRKQPKEMVREESREMVLMESEEMVRKKPEKSVRQKPKEKLRKVEKKQKNYSEDESDKKYKKRQKNKAHYGHLAGNRHSSEQETMKKDKRSDNGPLPATVPLTKANKEFYNDRKWRGGIIPYLIKPKLGYDIKDIRRRIEEVNAILKERTCTRLKEISEYEAGNAEDYLSVDDSPDYVTGRVGGKQIFGSVELLEGGQHRQHTAMMVMAMLGFYFEVSRHDRDKYIRVHMRHVRPDKLHHFEMIRSDATLAVPYDYQSATHPSWQFWRQYGRSGISTVATYKETDPDGTLMKSLGQNTKLLSETDIVKINSVYGVRCFLRSSSSHKNRGRKKIWQRERAYESQYNDE